jgi:formylglycine-generating enzyme required for sulfatase activity
VFVSPFYMDSTEVTQGEYTRLSGKKPWLKQYTILKRKESSKQEIVLIFPAPHLYCKNDEEQLLVVILTQYTTLY